MRGCGRHAARICHPYLQRDVSSQKGSLSHVYRPAAGDRDICGKECAGQGRKKSGDAAVLEALETHVYIYIILMLH